MGDLGATTHKSKEVHILVTGAGPWWEHARNPATMIASALPAQLKQSGSSEVNIEIHGGSVPWAVSYSWVKENIPPMLFPSKSDSEASADDGHLPKPTQPKPNYDLVLFLGMAAGRKYYTLEMQGHRDGYKFQDIDQKLPEDPDYWTHAGAPEVLSTSFDTDTLHSIWRENVPTEIDVRPSDNAGYYLCDYIYYTGLFEYWKQSGKDIKGLRPCMFLHVPGEAEEEDIARGVTVAKGLIQAMASCWVDRRYK